MSEPFPPIGAELARKNRRIIALRDGWPAGVVEVCEKLGEEFPCWHVSWSRGGGMLWTEPGLYAQRKNWHHTDPFPQWLYGADANELRDRLADHQPPERWSSGP